MKFGTFLLLQSPSARPPEEIFARGVRIGQAADRLGYDSIWCAEHHFSTYGYLSRPLMVATHIGSRTERIRVGSAVVVLPLHHPLIVAEEIATADILTGGRLDVGLGRGYQPYEFERLGMSLDESRTRFEEGVDILLKAFAGKPFAYEGKHYRIGETSVFPLPVQKPHPPLWVVGQSEESVVATARRGFNLISGGFGVPLERLREFRSRLDAMIGLSTDDLEDNLSRMSEHSSEEHSALGTGSLGIGKFYVKIDRPAGDKCHLAQHPCSQYDCYRNRIFQEKSKMKKLLDIKEFPPTKESPPHVGY